MANVELWFAKKFFAGLRQEFYEDLAEALDDNASLADEIGKFAKRARKERDVVAPIYRIWLNRMDDKSFSQSLIGTVPDADVMILEAAEGAGNMPDGLRFLAKAISATNTMVTSLKRAVSGFIFLSILLITLLAMFSFYGIDIIEQVVPPNAWPWIGQVLRDVARFITGNWLWILITLVTVSTGYIWSLPNWRGPSRVIADKYLPFYSIYRDFQGALFLVSIAALMRNNVSLTEALDKLLLRANQWLRWHIHTILLHLDYESSEPAKAFATGIFNKRLTWRIIDFGSRGKGSFAEAIAKVGLNSLDKVTQGVTDSARKINSMLLIASGLMMAFIIAGTMLTMYEAQNALQQQIQTVNTK